MDMVRMRARKPLERHCVPRLALTLALLLPASVFAQEVTVTPLLNAELTWTDNAGVGRDKDDDFILEVSPGISVLRTSGRFNGALSANLRNVMYADASERNSSFLTLNGRGEFEAIEDFLFVDLGASIGRNNLSAFSGRSSGDRLSTDKRSETRTWSIGPRLEFSLGGDARGSVRYLSRWIDSGSQGLGDQHLQRWTAEASDPTAFGRVGWGLSYTRSDSKTDSESTRDRTSDIGRATVFLNVSPQLRLRGIAGYEANDYEDRSGDSSSIYGAGLDWYPTERTAVSATYEDRIFGNGYDLSVSHRMSRSTWFLSASRDISSVADSLGSTPYIDGDCVNTLVRDPLFRPDLSDEIERFSAALLECFGVAELRSNAYFVQRSVRGGFSVLGVRNTLTFSISRSDRSRISDITGLPTNDDFLVTNHIRTTSVNASLSHRLSGLSTLVGSVTRSESESLDDAGLDTRRWLATLSLNRQLGPRTQGSLRYRHQRSEGSDDFTENSITAAVGMRF